MNMNNLDPEGVRIPGTPLDPPIYSMNEKAKAEPKISLGKYYESLSHPGRYMTWAMPSGYYLLAALLTSPPL